MSFNSKMGKVSGRGSVAKSSPEKNAGDSGLEHPSKGEHEKVDTSVPGSSNTQAGTTKYYDDKGEVERVLLAASAIDARLASVLQKLDADTEVFHDEHGQPFYFQNGEYFYLEGYSDHNEESTESGDDGLLVQYTIDPSSRRPVIVPVDRLSGHGFDDALEEEIQATVSSALDVVDSSLLAHGSDHKNEKPLKKGAPPPKRPPKPARADTQEEYISPYSQHVLNSKQQQTPSPVDDSSPAVEPSPPTHPTPFPPHSLNVQQWTQHLNEADTVAARHSLYFPSSCEYLFCVCITYGHCSDVVLLQMRRNPRHVASKPTRTSLATPLTTASPFLESPRPTGHLSSSSSSSLVAILMKNYLQRWKRALAKRKAAWRDQHNCRGTPIREMPIS